MQRRFLVLLSLLILFISGRSQSYPQNYFRHPLNIPMQLVANFGELRTNHWHMGLDIRTQQKQNLPVYAAAEGYIARVKIEPGGFGRAIYINHPNGYTTLYAHLNNFLPALEQYIKAEQYKRESWQVELEIPRQLFPVNKGSFIAYSGNTGGSQGPHVHFEIRKTDTDECLNPLLFSFPISDWVPPTISRLAMYDRNRSVYVQSPQLLGLRKAGNIYVPARSNLIKVGSDKISFAIGATDRFSNSSNPNGIYSARILMDDVPQSEFILDEIDYVETRYLNAQIDYRYKFNGGGYLQHLSRMPGDRSDVYTLPSDGVLQLTDNDIHKVRIEVRDARKNLSVLEFSVQYDPVLSHPGINSASKLIPNNVNVFESENLEVFTSEQSVYDTVYVTHTVSNVMTPNAISPVHIFCGAAIPTHDSVTVRIKPSATIPDKDRVIIKSVAGTRTVVEKADWQQGWVAAKFRQFGSYQAFVDTEPPTVNAPPTNLSAAKRLVFSPKDNFKTIKSFRVELDGQWLRFTNDKGLSHIYYFDEKFPRGEHQLKVRLEDEAGNVTEKVWNVIR